MDQDGSRRVVMLERTRKIAGCEDGTCPRVDETNRPGTLAVQGERVSWRARRRMRPSRGETVVAVPESVIDQAAADRGWIRP
jgi:hypothetical protein